MRYMLIIILFATIFSSCSKEETEEPCTPGDVYYELFPCLNSFMYEAGSYWIYQDTSSLQIDSIFASSWSNDVIYIGGTVCGVPEQREEIWINYQSSVKGNYTAHLRGQIITTNSQTIAPCVSTAVDSINIGGTLFYNVLEISTGGTFKGYYKEPMGFIRKIEYNPPIDTTTYDLINHQVTLFPNPF